MSTVATVFFKDELLKQHVLIRYDYNEEADTGVYLVGYKRLNNENKWEEITTVLNSWEVAEFITLIKKFLEGCK